METPFAIYDALSAIDVPPEKVRSVVQSLEHDMALFATRSQFDHLDQFSGSRFELLRAELKTFRDQVNQRFEQVDQRFDRVEEQVNQRFEQVNQRFDQVNQRFDQVNQRFGAIEGQIGLQIAAAQSHIENRLTIRLGLMLAGAVGLLTGLIPLILRLILKA